MGHPLLNENVIDKVASLAVGCCVAGGVLSAGAAPVVGAAVSVVAVLSAVGLRRAIGGKPECLKALAQVKRHLARDLVRQGEANEHQVREAVCAFDAALAPDAVFTTAALQEAMREEARLVPALTGHVLADMAGRDSRFAPGAGMARDLAQAILETAFARAAEACAPFRHTVMLTYAEITLQEVRGARDDIRDMRSEMMAQFEAMKTMFGQAGLAAGLNPAQVETLLTAFAHEGVPIDQAEALLLRSAQELTDLRARLLRFSNADPATADLKHRAAEAIAAGQIERARDLVLQAAERHRRAGEELADALKMHRLSEAEALAEAAGMERALSRLLDAADLYAQAAEAAAPFDTEAAWGYRLGEAGALQAHGDLFPGLEVLRRAVSTLRDRALPLAPEQDRPADWAMTQNDLGTALTSLGHRAGGPEGLAALNDSVVAYRAALRIYTEAKIPAQWAIIQSNLGSALRSLGDRAGGSEGLAVLNDAVAAFHAALRIQTQTNMPAGWATTQNNLGNALISLGQRAGGSEGLAALNDAVAAYRAALRVRTEADMPAAWATTQTNLGLALRILGERAGGAEGLAALNDTVAAYRAALRVRTEADMPAAWAMTQTNLGAALQRLGERAGGPEGLAALNEAVAAYRAALRVHTEADMPAAWAMTQNNLGVALRSLGDRAGGPEGLGALNEAVAAFRAALRVRTEADMPADWAMTQNNLGNALESLGGRAEGPEGLAALNEAVAALRAALRAYTKADMPADWAMTTANLCLVYETQSEITRDPGPVCAAVADMDRVIAVFEAMQASQYIDKAKRNRARMVALCRELGGTCAD